MRNDHESSEIRTLAVTLLQSGNFGGDLVIESGHVESPIAVQDPDRKLHSWFVPITVGSHLAAFFQFLPDDTFMRFSSFQRRAGELVGCPDAADWLDLKRIKERAQAFNQMAETSGEPFLTYDRSPDRLVWAVPLEIPGGEVRLVYVAGRTVYEPPPSESYG